MEVGKKLGVCHRWPFSTRKRARKEKGKSKGKEKGTGDSKKRGHGPCGGGLRPPSIPRFFFKPDTHAQVMWICL